MNRIKITRLIARFLSTPKFLLQQFCLHTVRL